MHSNEQRAMISLRIVLSNYVSRILILILLLGFYPVTAFSQFGKIEGRVFDPDDKPISNLHVTIKETKLGDATDSNGYFVIENITPGIYTLKFDHIGFKIKNIKNINILNDQVVTLKKIVLQPKVIQLNDVVVTATRTDRRIYDIPQPINLVSADMIKERNAKTCAEALREETGIFIQKTNHGGGSAIIRGLSSNQILILVDGIRLNNSTYRLGNHQYLTTVDNHIVNQLEIVRGPTSVLYGSDALGGTINLITNKPSPQPTHLELGYHFLSRFASADNERTLRSELSLQNHKFSLQTGFSSKNYGDLRRGENSDHPQLEKSMNGVKQTPTGFNAYDLDSKLVYTPTSHQTLILAYQMSKQKDVPRYDKYENDGYIRWLYQPQNRELGYLIYENNLQRKYITSLRASISYHRQEEGREILNEVASPFTKELDDVRTTGITLQFNSVFKKQLLIYGAELYFDKVRSTRFIIDLQSGQSEKDLQGRYPDGAVYNSFGFFLQDEINWNNRLSITLGFRYSYFYTKFALPVDSNTTFNLNKINQKFSSFTGSFGLVYKLSDQIYLNTNIGQAFRAPNLSDISKLGESKGNIYEVPNPALEPEKMMSFDIGLKINLDKLQANASAYYSHITDLLASAPTSYHGFSTLEINNTIYKIKTKKNIGNAFIRGFEATMDYNFYRQLFLYSNLTTTYGQNITNTEPVGGIPPTFGLIGLNWRAEFYSVYLYLRFASRQNRLSQDDRDDPRIPSGGTPGWKTFNFRTRLNFLKSVNLQVAIENIFDYNYREHGSGINGPGRNFILSLELKR